MSTFFTDLMEKGSKLYPEQAFDHWIDSEHDAACALGTVIAGYYDHGDATEVDYAQYAADGATEEGIMELAWAVMREAHILRSRVFACPSCGIPFDIVTVVTHMNDNHWWTREQIAAWLDDLLKQE